MVKNCSVKSSHLPIAAGLIGYQFLMVYFSKFKVLLKLFKCEAGTIISFDTAWLVVLGKQFLKYFD